MQAHLTDDFLCGVWAAAELHADVVAFAQLVDLEREAFATHALEFDGVATVALDDVGEMRREFVDLGIFKRGPDDIGDLVL